jgi:hypothetical protein
VWRGKSAATILVLAVRDESTSAAVSVSPLEPERTRGAAPSPVRCPSSSLRRSRMAYDERVRSGARQIRTGSKIGPKER